MIFFVDESGHPHPNDSTSRPVLVAVGYPLARSRELARTIHSIKRRFGYDDPRSESKLKANRILNERTFRKIPEKREYAEAIFSLCDSFPFVTFAIVMEKPRCPLDVHGQWLLPQHMYLLQRIQWLVATEAPDRYALVVFDSRDSKGDMELSQQLSGFLHRTTPGRSYDRIVDTALFVDSRITPGIQVSDLFASCLRQYHEVCRDRVRKVGVAYESAIRRLYETMRRTFRDVDDPTGMTLHGEYFLSGNKMESWGAGPPTIEEE